jgi:Holliday junction resolvasome RuvABC DNA-binding subunit
VSLGYNSADAEKAVRAALDANGRPGSATELIRAALTRVGGRK